MHSRTKIWMIVAGVVAAVLLAASLVLLFLKIRETEREEKELQAAQKEQQRLYGRDPFPSTTNILMESQNVATIRGEFINLLNALRSGQIDPVEQSPSSFNGQFWQIQKSLLTAAREKNVVVPADFHFGFQKQMAGNLPSKSDVPRLTQQVLTVQEICKVLYAAKVTEIKNIVREEFEGGEAGVPTGPSPTVVVRRGASAPAGGSVPNTNPFNKDTGLIPPGKWVGRMHYGVEFVGREASIRTVLNQLARHPMFVIVTRLDIAGEEGGGLKSGPSSASKERTATDSEALASVPEAVLSRDQRIVSGMEMPLTVYMEIDVCNFRRAELENK